MSKLDLRFQIISNGFSRDRSFGHKACAKYGRFSLEIGHSGDSRLGHTSIKDRHKSGYSATTQTTTEP